MPITQNYNINTGNAYEGMIYGLKSAMTIRTVEDARTADNKAAVMGQAVTPVANTVRGVEGLGAASAAGASCYGVIVRQINHEAATRPSDGTMAVNKGDVLGLMVEGAIMIKLGGTVARDAFVGQKLDGSWDTTAAFTNIRVLQAGIAGDLVPAQIFMVADAPVAVAAATK